MHREGLGLVLAGFDLDTLRRKFIIGFVEQRVVRSFATVVVVRSRSIDREPHLGGRLYG